jgi:hypothetical protein
MTRMSAFLIPQLVKRLRRGLADHPKYVLQLLLSTIFLIFFGTSAPAADFGIEHGTAVVVLRSPKAIYAAVDSKEIDTVYRDGKPSVAETEVCKIRKVGPYYSIVAGVMRGTNGFDALQEVSSAYKPGDDLEKLSTAVRESVPQALTPLLKSVLDADPAMYAKNYAAQAALHLTLIGSEQNSPKVMVVEFRAVEATPGTVTMATRTMSCPGDCPGPSVGYFLGAHEAVEESVRRNPAILNKPDEDGVEKLIGLEYASRPDIVGGPVSMLKISPSGATVLRNGACALN